MKDKNKVSMKLVVSGVMLATLIGKILGFLKELVLAYFFGAGEVSDAYLISQTIPGTLFMIIGTGIATCYVPIYVKVKTNDGKNEADTYTNIFITLIEFVSLGIALFVLIFPGFFVKIFAVGFNNDTFILAKNFTRINAISLVFSGFLYCISALLQSENNYLHVAVSNIPYNIGLIAAIIIGSLLSIYALSIVSVIAVIIQLIYQWYYVRKIPYKYKVSFRFNDPRIKMPLSLLPPIILGVAAAEVNTLIDRTIASSIIVGGITVITYGTSLFDLIIGVFSNSISAVYYPTISEAVVLGDEEKLSKTIQDAIFLAIFFLLPCISGTVVLREQIVKLLFGHGEFGLSHVKELSIVFSCYSIGFIPFAIKQILNNVYYSHEMTKKPMINTIISVIVNVILNIILSRFWGLAGLAIATGIAAIVVAILLIKDCRNDFNILIICDYKKILLLFLSTVLMGFVCFLLKKILNDNDVYTIIIILISSIIYILITCLLKICPININMFKGRVMNG